MSKINKTTKLKQLKLKYPTVKAWVHENDIWSPASGHMPPNKWTYENDSKNDQRPDYYYLVLNIIAQVGAADAADGKTQKFSSICYLREQLDEMGCIVPCVASCKTYANDLVAPAPKSGNKKTGKIGYAQRFEVKREKLKTWVNAIAKRK